MAKEVKKKESVTKKSSPKSHVSDAAVDRLIESNISLQHKMTDVFLGVKELNSNVTDLVKIFKSAGEHIKSAKYEDPMVAKINDLLEQNKNISQALLLLEKFVKDNVANRPNPLKEATQY
jgi:PAB1-binding protein PBP1